MRRLGRFSRKSLHVPSYRDSQVVVTEEDLRQGRGLVKLSVSPCHHAERAQEPSGGLTVGGTRRLGLAERHFGK